jgi:small GTP-binding protein
MEQNKQHEINIMILGQTGVGKSTLINYLYGSDVVKTGTGKPVTGRNDFTKITVPSPLKPEVKINIFDSWGLESDKAEDWKAVINNKLSGRLFFDEMIYGIVYCSSYSNDRIQDFEIKMLKELLSKGYKVIIALTNADNSGYELKKTVFCEKFSEKLPEYRDKYSVVDVCAQAKPKLGQPESSAKTFGKEALFEELEKNVYENFFNVFLNYWIEWRSESIKVIREFRENQTRIIAEFKGGFFESSFEKQRRISEISEEMRKEAKKKTSQIFNKIKDGMEDAKELYPYINGSFASSIKPTYLINGFFSFIEKILLYLIGGSFNKSEIQGEIQGELHKELKSLTNAIENKILEFYDKAVEKIKKLKIN